MLTLGSVLKAVSHWIQSILPGGIVLALAAYWIFDLAVIGASDKKLTELAKTLINTRAQ